MKRMIGKLSLLLAVLHGTVSLAQSPAGESNQVLQEPPYDAAFVSRLVADAQARGDVTRGAQVFSNAKLACLSCHRVGSHGGIIGPDLSILSKERTSSHIVESLWWPRREVKPEFTNWTILTVGGQVVTGYKVRETDQAITLKEPASEKLISIAREEVEEEVAGSTLMPNGLITGLTSQQQLDLIRFLCDLGRDGNPLSAELQQVIADSQSHGPAKFEFTAAPLQPQRWPGSNLPVNRDRVYDFYTKQAEYFRQQPRLPRLLAAAPELDGGKLGHFGNQSDDDWVDGRWNETELGSVQAGVLHTSDGKRIIRAICLRLGENDELSACFNPDTLNYEAVWSGGFVSFSTRRHGFLHGLKMEGTPVATRTISVPAGIHLSRLLPTRQANRLRLPHWGGGLSRCPLGGRWAVHPRSRTRPGSLTAGDTRRRSIAMATGFRNPHRSRDRSPLCHRHHRTTGRQPMEGSFFLWRSRFSTRRERAAVHDARRCLACRRLGLGDDPTRGCPLEAFRFGPTPSLGVGGSFGWGLRAMSRSTHSSPRLERGRRSRFL
jgi:putative heme-binding domain-containing protein